MKRLDLAVLATGAALLSLGLLHASVPEARQHERPAHQPAPSIDCIPVEQSLLERDALGLPEPMLVPQMGGMLA